MKTITFLLFLCTAQAQAYCCSVQGALRCGTKLTCDPLPELTCAEGLIKYCTYGYAAQCECIPDNGITPTCGGEPGEICSEADDGRCFCYPHNSR